ncbi:hypothetical protein ACVW0I_005264 [Bradyrhizobium sp. LM6.11]
MALWVAAAKAVKTNSEIFSSTEVRGPATTSRNSDSTDSPAKMSVSSMLASQGSAVDRIKSRQIATKRNVCIRPSTRKVSCSSHSVATDWTARLIQKPKLSP